VLIKTHIKNKKILAIIPARKGSKRLVNKNILKLNKKPLFQWTLDVALKARIFNQIYLSTDSKKIMNLVKNKDCVCPKLRKTKLSGDKITLVDVCLDVLNYIQKKYDTPDAIVLLQPTSPFRSIDIIYESLNKFFSISNKARNSVVSVEKVKKPPMWCFKKKNGYLIPYLKNNGINLQSQSLEPTFAPTGSIYIVTPNNLRSNRSFFTKKTLYVEPNNKFENLDIDEKFDVELAKSILKNGIKKFKNF
tara:strand:- start:875 stop:1618 length:744 start_codon:yes stop_codon:yes gene_type:complete